MFYKGAVIALSKGKEITFNMAKSKPRVRQAKDKDGYSPRMKALEATRKQAAIDRVLRRHPALAAKYGVDVFQVLCTS